MITTYRFRRFHRYMGVVVGIQILFWTLSGLYFSWFDLDEIHGDHNRAPRAPLIIDPNWTSPTVALTQAAAMDSVAGLLDFDLLDVNGSRTYHLRYVNGQGDPISVLADAVTGNLRGPIRRDEAVAMARQSFLPQVQVSRVAFLTDEMVDPHHEYRGGPLPAWQVHFDHPSGTRVYISATQAKIIAHRNLKWRIFDFLWMFHTMDYRSRDDFNNFLLRSFSVLGLVTVVSGFVLFAMTSPRLRKRR